MSDHIINSIPLFDFLDEMFLSTSTKYDCLTDKAKGSHFFMTQRFMCIAYPAAAQQANKNGIDGCAMLDMYHSRLGNPKGKPRWIFTGATKPTSEMSASMQAYTKYSYDVKCAFCKIADIELRSLDMLAEQDADLLLKELDELGKQMRNTTTKSRN